MSKHPVHLAVHSGLFRTRTPCGGGPRKAFRHDLVDCAACRASPEFAQPERSAQDRSEA